MTSLTLVCFQLCRHKRLKYCSSNVSEDEIIKLTCEGIFPRRLCVRLEIVTESEKLQVFIVRQYSIFVKRSLRLGPAVERNAFGLRVEKYVSCFVRQLIEMKQVLTFATYRLYIHVPVVSSELLKL
jgi:hypothetical protein